MKSNGKYDYIIIDGTTVVDDIKTASYEILDQVIMLTYNKIENVKCIFSSLNIINNDVKSVNLIVNKTIDKEEKKGNLLTIEEIQEILRVKVDGKVEFMQKLDSFGENFLNNEDYNEITKVMEEII